MKRLFLFFLLFLLVNVNAFSLSVESFLSLNAKTKYIGIIPNMLCSVNFLEKSTIEFRSYNSENVHDIWNKSFHYELTEEYGLKFLQFRHNSSLKKYLLLISDYYLVLYDTSNSNLIFWGTTVARGSTEGHFTYDDKISATSELKECLKVYKAQNMSHVDSDEPWVEGKNGYGVGEKIFLPFGKNITIYSGYISAKKPWLWKQNSRPKTLLICSKKSGLCKQVELKDTPMPQTISLDKPYDDIEITILEVYKGTKYDDTCIHLITGCMASLIRAVE